MQRKYRVFFTLNNSKRTWDCRAESKAAARSAFDKHLDSVGGGWAYPIEIIDVEDRMVERATLAATIALASMGFSKNEKLKSISENADSIAQTTALIYDKLRHFLGGDGFDAKDTANKLFEIYSPGPPSNK